MKTTMLTQAALKRNGNAPTRIRMAPALADEGLLVMDLLLQPLAADRGAAAILAGANQENGNRTEPSVHIPKEIRDVLSSWSAEDLVTNLPATTMHFRAGKACYTCRAFLVQPHVATGAPMLALHFQKDASLASAIDLIAAEYHLTEREQQAMKGIAAGLTSKEMAARMNISPNTVKSFLRIIMLKMGVATRAGLVAKLLDEYSSQGGKYAGRA